MKKYLKSLLMLLAIVFSLSLFACNNDQQNNGDQGGNNEPDQSVTDAIDMQVVCNADIGDKLYSELYSKLMDRYGTVVLVVPDTLDAKSREIVIGESNRDISKTAYLQLSRVQKDVEENVAYLIYSDGNSLAIAYEEDKYGLNAAANFSIDYFIENLLATFGDQPIKKGVVAKGSLDPVVYQDAIDDKILADAWLKLESEAGKDVVAATQDYYSMYSDRLISWLADLYDPDTGAFYFSNSGRNTEGYLPDIEATFHALSMIENSGMVNHLGGKYQYLPGWFLEKMANWVKSLQDPNGYFYHPQWGKELTDTKVTRRGRDLSYGGAILAAGGVTRTYDSPDGSKGNYTLNNGTKVDAFGNPVVDSTSALTHLLCTSVAEAVSKVQPTAGTYSPYLQDAKSFEAYLYSLDLRNDSYRVGNTLSNQVSEIKNRDKELGGVLVPIIERWLIEFQNPATGTWVWKSESDPTYSAYSHADGVLKLLTTFNGLGIEYPNPIPATETLIMTIYTDEDPGSVCQPYNSWYALEDLFKNLRAHSKNSAETERVIGEIRGRLRADAVNLINKTAEKVAKFIKEDSSSSFAQKYSSDTSQGMRVAVPHTNEGDTNATTINTFGTLNHMFNVLGWSKPSMFGKGDYYRFMYMIENQSPVIKNKEPDPNPLDFEDEAVGTSPVSINLEKCSSSGEKAVIQDPTNFKMGNVYKFESNPDGHDSFWMTCDSQNLTASCYIYEADMYLTTPGDGYFSRIYIDESYFLGLYVDDGMIHFIDASSQGGNRREQSLMFSTALEEWFNLRIEYYAGELETVRIKIYLNGECVAVSNNFWDSKSTGVPYAFYSKASIEAFTGADMTWYLDNVLIHKTNDIYKEETDPSIKVNVDALDKDALLYDFEDGALPEDITVSGATGNITVKDTAGDKALNIKGSDASTVNLPLNKRTKEANAYIFDSYVTLNAIDTNAKFEILFNDAGIMNTSVMRFWIVGVNEGGENYGALYECSGGLMGSIIPGVKLVAGEEVRLTIEYYEKENAALIYVDGKLVAFSSATEAYAKRTFAGKVMLNKIGTGNVDISFDDITAEINVKSFEQSVKPDKESVTHKFEDGLIEGATLTGGEIVVRDGANKVVSFKGGASLTVPNNKRGVVYGTFVFKATFNISKDAQSGESFDIAFTSADGSTVLKYNVKVEGGKAAFYEITANNTYTNPIAEMSLGTDVTVTIEYYAKREVAHVYFGDICYAVTSITYSTDSGKIEPSAVTIKTDSTSLGLTVDNVVMETYDKFYAHQTATGQNPETNANKITFESSTTGNLPQRFSTDLRTASAAIRIKEMMRGDKASKAMEFETSAGANDKLSFLAQNDGTTGKKVTVFESAVAFDMNGGDATYELYLSNKDGRFSYLLILAHSGSTLSINDITGNSSANVPGRIWGSTVTVNGIDEGEWFDLKVEYYEGDHDTVRIKTYINGELVYVSKGYYGRSTTTYGTQPVNSIDRVMLSSYGSVVGKMYLDDMSIYKTDKFLRDDPLTYTPKEAEQIIPNDEDNSPILGFESSKTGNLPAPITKELLSSGGALTVKEVLRSGVKTKVMAFTTTSDYGDKLFIAKTKKLEGYNAVEFSTKMMVEEGSKGGQLYFYFRNGTTVLNRIVVSIDADGIGFSDYYNSAYSFSDAQGKTGVSAFEWNTLSMTLYSYNGFCRIVIKIGDFTIVSKNSSWSSLTPDKITSIRIDTSTASDMTVLFDDLSLQEKKIVIPAEHEHTYEETWTYDDIYHYHKSTCADNSECAVAVKDKAEHSFANGNVCVCGYKKVVIGGNGSLGYFASLGGFNYEDTNGNHWKWSSSNTAKIIRNTGYTSGDQWTVEGATPNYAKNYFNFLKIAGNYVAEFGKGTTTTVPSEIYFASQGGSGNIFVYETDIYLGATSVADGKELLTFGFDSATIGYKGATRGVVRITASVADGAVSYKLFDTLLTADTWYNLAVEYNSETGTAAYYINGEKIGVVRMTNAPSDVGHFAIKIPAEIKGAIVRFDNTCLKFVGASLAEEGGAAAPEISESHAAPHVHTYSQTWTYDSEKHWHKASCSDNSECATAVSEEAAHSLDADGKCACGYSKTAEPVKSTLGYFDAFGGFDYEDATTHWTWSAKNTIKIVRDSNRTSGDQFNADGTPDLSKVGYLNFYDLNGNRIVEFGKGTANSNPSEIYFVKQSGIGNTLVFETDIRLSTSTALVSADDKTFLTFGFINEMSSAAVGYAEATIVGVPSSDIISSYTFFDTVLSADVWYNFAVEFNTETGVATYYIDADIVGTTQVADIPAGLGYFRVDISGNAKEANVKFDDTYFGSIGKHLTESDEYYTFNDGKVPENFSTLLKSECASLTVTDYPMITSNEKVLALVTKPGTQDFFYVPVKVTEGGDKIVFETKLKVSAVVNSEFKFEFTGVNNKVFGAYNFSINPDGKVSVSDFYNDYNDATENWSFSTAYVNVTPDSWVDFKLVGYVQDGAFRVDMYVNGDKAATSTHAGFAGTTLADITHFRYQAFSAMDAVIYFDDFKVAVIKEEQQ